MTTLEGRPLGASEKSLFLCNVINPFNVVFVLDLFGFFSTGDCVAAIDRLQAQHPLLRVRVPFAPPCKLEFLYDPSLRISLRDCHDEATNLPAHLEHELRTPFDTAQGPLTRFARIRHTYWRSTVLITCHHSITDGLSGSILARDFLNFLGNTANASTNSALPAPIEARLPRRLRGVKGLLAHATEGLRLVKAQTRHGSPQPHALCEADASTLHAIVACRQLGERQLAGVLAGCKLHRCSMQGALGAALLQAAHANLPPHHFHAAWQLLSPVNLRQSLVPPARDEVGLFVATQTTHHQVSGASDFWALARTITVQLRNGIERDGPLAFMPIASRWIVRMIDIAGRVFGVERFTKWVCASFPPCIGVSNLGALDLDTTYGAIRLQRFSFLASLSSMGALSTFALTLSSRLMWNFVGMEPLMDREHLQAVADDSLRRLDAACRSIDTDARAA